MSANRIAAEAIGNGGADAIGDREEVFSTAADGGGIFAAADDLVGEGRVEGRVERGGPDALKVGIGGSVADALTLVVERNRVHDGRQRHVGFGVVHGRGGGARGIFLLGDGVEPVGDDGAGDIGVLFAALVAGAPHDDGRVVAIATNEGTHVLFVPVGVDQMGIEGRFLTFPHVEALIDDQKAHAVGQIEEFGGGRVVGHADGVAAHPRRISNWHSAARTLKAAPRVPRS